MKKSYFKGIVGALLFGVICTVPWVLIYVYGNMILSILGAVIGYGAYFGYKLFRGKVTSKTPIIISIISILAVTLATFVVIPLLLVAKEGYGFNLDLFKLLYTDNNFIGAIIKDYIFSVFFTILGISVVIKKVKEEAYGIKKEENSEYEDIYFLPFEKQVEHVKELYGKYDAFSKDKTVSERKIISELKTKHKLSVMLKMEKAGLVIAPFDKSYFDIEAIDNKEKAKKNKMKNTMPGIFIGIGIGIVMFLIPLLVFLTFDDSKKEKPSDNNIKEEIKNKKYEFANISIMLPEGYVKLPGDNYSTVEYASGNKVISNVALQELDAPIDYYETFIEEYKKELSANYKIISDEQSVVDTKQAHIISMEKLSDSKHKCKLYVVSNNNKIDIIMLFSVYNNEGFEEKCLEYISTVTIKNS